jgi:hypothetical protein
LTVTTSVGYTIAQPGDTMEIIVNRAQTSLQQASAKRAAAAPAGSHGNQESSEI